MKNKKTKQYYLPCFELHSLLNIINNFFNCHSDPTFFVDFGRIYSIKPRNQFALE